eukprot:scaffold13050_cov59-Phaeocystis_antarctica.AAC.1
MKVSCTSISSAPEGDLGACREGAHTSVESGCRAGVGQAANGRRAGVARAASESGERTWRGHGAGERRARGGRGAGAGRVASSPAPLP